jgi:hypothetical protein
LAAGCNKPADDIAEEAVEVVRNHEDGTRLRGWNPRGRSDDPRVGAGVDAGSDVDGGAKRHIVRYPYRAVWTNPGEKAVESARAKGESSEVGRR